MGIQINGQTDTISASDGGLAVSGYELTGPSNINVTGIITTSQLNVGTGGTVITTTAGGDINIDSGGVYYDASNNRLAIGTTSPGGLLEIKSANQNPALFRLYNAYNTAGSSWGVDFYRDSGGGTNLATAEIKAVREGSNDTSIKFGTSSTPGTVEERARIDSSGRLLVGTPSARTNFYNTTVTTGVQLEGLGGQGRLLSIVSDTNDAFSEPNLILGKTRSTTLGGNTAVQSGDPLGAISFQGADGSELVEGANIIAYADGAVSANDLPTRLVFSTTASGVSPTERMRIGQNGYLKASNSGNYVNTSENCHELVSNTSDTILARFRSNSSNGQQYGIMIQTLDDQNDGTRYFLICLGSSTTRAKIKANGGFDNYQSNDSNLCDEREKKNIETLESTWGCLKNWELKKFHYNEDADTEDKRYGIIAQQVAPHCPEVITDWIKQEAKEAVLDDDGNVVTPAVEEIVRMGVKEQQMMWMAIKALQEAQTRIETLEAKVAALEAQ